MPKSAPPSGRASVKNHYSSSHPLAGSTSSANTRITTAAGCAFAIDRHIVLAAGTGRDRTRLIALDRDETVEFDPGRLPAPHRGHWSDYMVGMLAEFRSAGFDFPPIEACFAGSNPARRRASSSAALACAMGLALDRIAASALPREAIALMAQSTEHKYAGVNCGIIDQYATLLCQRERGLLLDCRMRAYRQVPLRIEPYRFVL